MPEFDTVPPEQTAPLFIIGAPRSGTTFLSSFFGKTRYGYPFESHFIPKAYEMCLNGTDLNDYHQFEKVFQIIQKERAIMQYAGYQCPKKTYDSLSKPISLTKLIDFFCFAATGRDKPSWGDKTPWYIKRLNILHDIYPTAKFVFIFRDGRDVACSLLQKPWGPNNIYACAKLWVDHNFSHKSLISSLESKHNLISVSYEELIDSPEETIRSIFQFINEPINKDVFDKIVGTTKKGNYFKWKKRLTKRQVEVFESIAHAELKELGYETMFDDKPILNKLNELWLVAHEYFYRAIHLFKLNVIDTVLIKFGRKEPFAD